MKGAFRWIVLPTVGVIAIAALAYVVFRTDSASPQTFVDRPIAETSAVRDFSADTRGADSVSLEKPEAMRDSSAYAALRLREIKTHPDEWKDAAVWQREFATADTPELQREVLGLARQIGDGPLLAVLAQALAAADYMVRLDAARSIGWLHEDDLAQGIAIGVASPDPEMRMEAMAIAQNAPSSRRREIMERTLSASAEDVQLQSVEIISEQPSRALVGLLVDRFQHSEGALRDAINEAIENVTQQRFASSRDAVTWWTANADRFDDLMLPKEQ